ncbi:MAG: hypothetical protein H6737_28785 [Alphaproteobacteria bacterium]|nr:hypothetical protein [Alphaproteobacteria bacterium]
MLLLHLAGCLILASDPVFTCIDDGDCRGEERCIGRYCVLSECAGPGECGFEAHCEDDFCVDGCIEKEDCLNWYCGDAGECVECKRDEHCRGSETCNARNQCR